MMIDKEELALVAKLHTKKLAVLKAVSRVPKNGRNEFHKYDYATEGDIVDTIRHEMAEAGLSFRASCTAERTEGIKTTVTMEIAIIDCETGYSETAQFYGYGEDKGDKGLYKAYTGAQKYALMKSFLLSTGDDPEADEGTPPKGRQATPTTRQAPGPAQAPRQTQQAKAVEVYRTAATDTGAKAALFDGSRAVTEDGEIVRATMPTISDEPKEVAARQIRVLEAKLKSRQIGFVHMTEEDMRTATIEELRTKYREFADLLKSQPVTLVG